MVFFDVEVIFEYVCMFLVFFLAKDTSQRRQVRRSTKCRMSSTLGCSGLRKNKEGFAEGFGEKFFFAP